MGCGASTTTKETTAGNNNISSTSQRTSRNRNPNNNNNSNEKTRTATSSSSSSSASPRTAQRREGGGPYRTDDDRHNDDRDDAAAAADKQHTTPSSSDKSNKKNKDRARVEHLLNSVCDDVGGDDDDVPQLPSSSYVLSPPTVQRFISDVFECLASRLLEWDASSTSGLFSHRPSNSKQRSAATAYNTTNSATSCFSFCSMPPFLQRGGEDEGGNECQKENHSNSANTTNHNNSINNSLESDFPGTYDNDVAIRSHDLWGLLLENFSKFQSQQIPHCALVSRQHTTTNTDAMASSPACCVWQDFSKFVNMWRCASSSPSLPSSSASTPPALCSHDTTILHNAVQRGVQLGWSVGDIANGLFALFLIVRLSGTGGRDFEGGSRGVPLQPQHQQQPQHERWAPLYQVAHRFLVECFPIQTTTTSTTAASSQSASARQKKPPVMLVTHWHPQDSAAASLAQSKLETCGSVAISRFLLVHSATTTATANSGSQNEDVEHGAQQDWDRGSVLVVQFQCSNDCSARRVPRALLPIPNSSNAQGSRRESDATLSSSALYLVPIATRFHVRSRLHLPQLGAEVVTLVDSLSSTCASRCSQALDFSRQYTQRLYRVVSNRCQASSTPFVAMSRLSTRLVPLDEALRRTDPKQSSCIVLSGRRAAGTSFAGLSAAFLLSRDPSDGFRPIILPPLLEIVGQSFEDVVAETLGIPHSAVSTLKQESHRTPVVILLEADEDSICRILQQEKDGERSHEEDSSRSNRTLFDCLNLGQWRSVVLVIVLDAVAGARFEFPATESDQLLSRADVCPSDVPCEFWWVHPPSTPQLVRTLLTSSKLHRLSLSGDAHAKAASSVLCQSTACQQSPALLRMALRVLEATNADEAPPPLSTSWDVCRAYLLHVYRQRARSLKNQSPVPAVLSALSEDDLALFGYDYGVWLAVCEFTLNAPLLRQSTLVQNPRLREILDDMQRDIPMWGTVLREHLVAAGLLVSQPRVLFLGPTASSGDEPLPRAIRTIATHHKPIMEQLVECVQAERLSPRLEEHVDLYLRDQAVGVGAAGLLLSLLHHANCIPTAVSSCSYLNGFSFDGLDLSYADLSWCDLTQDQFKRATEINRVPMRLNHAHLIRHDDGDTKDDDDGRLCRISTCVDTRCNNNDVTFLTVEPVPSSNPIATVSDGKELYFWGRSSSFSSSCGGLTLVCSVSSQLHRVSPDGRLVACISNNNNNNVCSVIPTASSLEIISIPPSLLPCPIGGFTWLQNDVLLVYGFCLEARRVALSVVIVGRQSNGDVITTVLAAQLPSNKDVAPTQIELIGTTTATASGKIGSCSDSATRTEALNITFHILLLAQKELEVWCGEIVTASSPVKPSQKLSIADQCDWRSAAWSGGKHQQQEQELEGTVAPNLIDICRAKPNLALTVSITKNGDHVVHVLEWSRGMSTPMSTVQAFTLTTNDTVKSAKFSHHGDLVVTATERTLAVWDVSSGARVASWRTDGHTVSAAVFDYRTTCVMTSALFCHALPSSARGQDGHTEPVTSLTFSLDGASLFTGSLDGTTKLWDVETGAMLISVSAPNPRSVLALDYLMEVEKSNEAYLVSCHDDGTVCTWRVTSEDTPAQLLSCLHTVKMFEQPKRATSISIVSFSLDCAVIGVHGLVPPPAQDKDDDTLLTVWNLAGGIGKPSRLFHTNVVGLTKLVIASTSECAIVSCCDSKIRRWTQSNRRFDPECGVEFRAPTTDVRFTCVAGSVGGEGRYVAVGTTTASVLILDASTLTQLRTLTLPASSSTITCLAFEAQGSNTARLMAGASLDGVLCTWMGGGEWDVLQCTRRIGAGAVLCLTFSPYVAFALQSENDVEILAKHRLRGAPRPLRVD
eukprot:PhM_4_TR15713/c2_g3_i4/m.28649